MLNAIKTALHEVSKFLMPKRLFWFLKNVYHFSTLEENQFRALVKLIEENEKSAEVLRDQFERVKQRAIIADGKLNYLLYGPARDKWGDLELRKIENLKSSEQLKNDINVANILKPTADQLRARYQNRLHNLIEGKFFDTSYLVNKDYIDLGVDRGIETSMFKNILQLGKTTGVSPFAVRFEEEALREDELVNADVVNFLNFTNKKASFVSAIKIVEHLSLSDQYYLLSKAFEIIESGGYLYIEVPNTYSYKNLVDIYWADIRNHRLYPVSAVRALAENIGFKSFLGVYRKDGTIVALDKYLESNSFFNDEYSDLFMSLRKP